MAVHHELKDGIGHLLLDRPDKAHAYDQLHLVELRDAFEALSAEASVIVLGSTGSGAFCGGADLDEVRARHAEDAMDLLSQRVFDAIARSPAVSIAAVQGPAIGGGFELALCCDFRVAAPAARFRFVEMDMGLVPAAGGCTRLLQLVGPARTKELVLLGTELTAERAHVWGLVTSVDDDCHRAAEEIAKHLQDLDPVALRTAKELIDSGAGLTEERLAQAALYERLHRKEP